MEYLSLREAYGKKLAEMDNENIVVLSADLANSTNVLLFKEKHPERFFEVGISEQDMIGISEGFALSGKIPLCHTFGIFFERAFEQIRNGISYMDLNVKLIASHTGLTVGDDGATAQSLEDIALFRVLPNFNVIVPCDANEAKKAVDEILKINKPCYLRLSREKFPLITNENDFFEIGKANILREGKDLSIIACGRMVFEALTAADKLKEENINAMVVNLHTIKPIDKESLYKAAESGIIITAEEHNVSGGMGSAISEALNEIPVFIKNLGVDDKFGQSGKPEELLNEYGLTSEHIVAVAKDVLKLKSMINEKENNINNSNIPNNKPKKDADPQVKDFLKRVYGFK